MLHQFSRATLIAFLRMALLKFGLVLPLLLCGCPQEAVPDFDSSPSNTTDPTNAGAGYLGSATCQACHPQIGQFHSRHGHSQILQRIQGQPPQYPPALPQAGVPDPPAGLSWMDIAFVIGGYTKAASFVGRDGHVLTDAASGLPIEYNLPLAVLGNSAGFDSFAGIGHAPYSLECFRCHTTGPESVEATGQRQDNLPGIGGTWALAGVQCEACHGPGSNHVPNPSAANIFLDPTSATCARCHSSGTGQVQARDGFIVGNQQADEVQASPHASFTCSVCHDPHASVFADSETAIRNECQVCHSTMNMALHQGIVFTRGDQTEELSCKSCHMTYAARYAQSAAPGFAGPAGRIGDTRSHVVVINPEAADYTSMFTADGTSLALGPDGRGFVTVDFVCLRCHNGQGNAFELSLSRAAEIASEIHTPLQ